MFSQLFIGMFEETPLLDASEAPVTPVQLLLQCLLVDAANRKDLRAELERRVAAEGYKMADIFPELGAGASSGARRKRPAKYRNPQNPEQAWGGTSDGPRSGCRRSSTNAASTWPPSSRSRCIRSTPRAEPTSVREVGWAPGAG